MSDVRWKMRFEQYQKAFHQLEKGYLLNRLMKFIVLGLFKYLNLPLS